MSGLPSALSSGVSPMAGGGQPVVYISLVMYMVRVYTGGQKICMQDRSKGALRVHANCSNGRNR